VAYRREVPPLPPPLRGIVIDGSNVIASSRHRVLERLDAVLAWCREWRPDLPVMVFVDATTARRCRPEVQDVLRARCADVTPGRARFAVTPPHEFADEHVLRWAREHDGLVVSNDRFFDWDDLRANVTTVQFTLAEDVLRMFDEATWFRSPGQAVRVPMAELQRLRVSGA
jgi:hypothetical protein